MYHNSISGGVSYPGSAFFFGRNSMYWAGACPKVVNSIPFSVKPGNYDRVYTDYESACNLSGMARPTPRSDIHPEISPRHEFNLRD